MSMTMLPTWRQLATTNGTEGQRHQIFQKNTHGQEKWKVCLQKKKQTSTETILKAISLLGKCLDRMEINSKQMQQHSSMLADITKPVLFNSEELKECKMKNKHLGRKIMTWRYLYWTKKDLIDCMAFTLTAKRTVNESIRAAVVELLGKIAPLLAAKMDYAVDIHWVGRAKEKGHG